ncbi:MAG: DNA recombination protein RmuC [Bacilli bacterium]|nr:DNA recombination protein RmuC [Bacilli bacterium]MDD4282304.1 DNA recombination protein RmuC [Bacilli bacterium]MDD4718763.1 DNA recombination protein RmuC [Bacilli bacterium]
MEYIIIALLVIILILGIISVFKNINESNITERLGRLETNMIKELNDFKDGFSRSLTDDFNLLNDKLEQRLRLINDKVNERLDENFEKTNKTFTSVLERLAKIDEAQKKIDLLSNDIVSLQSVLTDKKSRGVFGEVHLAHIMSSIFGDNNNKIYQMQYSFNNSTIADCVLFAPEPLGVIAIDSKFPLENYQAMVNRENSEVIRTNAEKIFKQDMKKHIDDISSKYIIPGVTSDQAILFLPAEAIFAEVHAYHQDLIDYSYKKKVWITSPTTLISTLTTIQIIIKNIERDKYASIIHQELKYLDNEFKRYKDRWDRLSKSIDTVSREVKDIHTTTDKITKKFNSISQVEIQELDYEINKED